MDAGNALALPFGRSLWAADPVYSYGSWRKGIPKLMSWESTSALLAKLLGKAVGEAKQELQGDVEQVSASEKSRRLDGLRIALYSLGKLESHMHQSSRILNDLRILRRLLLAEREIKRKSRLSKLRGRTDENAPAEGIEAPPADESAPHDSHICETAGGVKTILR